LNSVRNQRRFNALPTRRTLAAELALLVAIAPFAMAQTTTSMNKPADVVATNVSLQLPDSPDVFFNSSSSSTDIATDSTDPTDASFAQTPTPAAKPP
jgi:hypothetical protein